MAKPSGVRGSWFAVWRGQSLPCVHKRWFKKDRYADPWVTDNPKWGPFIDAIRNLGLVILTDDELDTAGIPTRRTGYIGMYRVENVTVSNSTLEFDFVERLESFS